MPCITYSDAQMLRETCATPILKQVNLYIICQNLSPPIIFHKLVSHILVS